MKLTELKPDETKSNPMVVAFKSDKCPIGEACFYMTMGFGTVPKKCTHLNQDAINGGLECLRVVDE